MMRRVLRRARMASTSRTERLTLAVGCPVLEVVGFKARYGSL